MELFGVNIHSLTLWEALCLWACHNQAQILVLSVFVAVQTLTLNVGWNLFLPHFFGRILSLSDWQAGIRWAARGRPGLPFIISSNWQIFAAHGPSSCLIPPPGAKRNTKLDHVSDYVKLKMYLSSFKKERECMDSIEVHQSPKKFIFWNTDEETEQWARQTGHFWIIIVVLYSSKCPVSWVEGGENWLLAKFCRNSISCPQVQAVKISHNININSYILFLSSSLPSSVQFEALRVRT